MFSESTTNDEVVLLSEGPTGKRTENKDAVRHFVRALIKDQFVLSLARPEQEKHYNNKQPKSKSHEKGNSIC